jgi:hypothetical protein
LSEIGLKAEAKKMKLTYSKYRKPIEGIELINVEIPSKREELRNIQKDKIRRGKQRRVKEPIGLDYEFNVDISESSEDELKISQ